MKNRIILATALTTFAVGGMAFAQGTNGSGTLWVTASVQGSILMTFSSDSSGLTLTNSGSSASALPFSTVQMYGGSVPTNVTKTLHGIASFDLSTPFDVRVDIANDPSLTFTMSATLASTDAVNTWTVGGNVITASSGAITATGAYATVVPYTFKINVPATAAAGLITNSLTFAVVSN